MYLRHVIFALEHLVILIAFSTIQGFGDVNMTHSIYCDVVETLLDNGCDVNYIVNTRHEATIIKASMIKLDCTDQYILNSYRLASLYVCI